MGVNLIQFFRQFFNIESFSAIFAWLVIAISTVYLMAANGNYSILSMVTSAVLFLVFIVFFMLAISDTPFVMKESNRVLFIAIEYVAVLGIVFIAPYTHIAILITIWSSHIPYLLSMRTAFLLLPIWSMPIWLIYGLYWDQEFILLSAVLYCSFNLFALVMVNGRLKEERAKQQANELNRELMATQALLGEATKQAERVRIARNIHDLLGHHLTALTINLQVASRISDGEAKQKIQECHNLAKLLLSDVREAVSEIREKSNLQLETAIAALVENVPKLDVQIEYSDELNISDVTVAETLLRCIQEGLTNSLKHSDASDFYIKITENEHNICLEMIDNGKSKRATAIEVRSGNGITGMQERIYELGGQLKVEQTQLGFRTSIEIPAFV